MIYFSTTSGPEAPNEERATSSWRCKYEEEEDSTNDESVEQSLLSCEKHRNICLRIFKAFIDLTAEVGRLK